jgi:hypothetical protein
MRPALPLWPQRRPEQAGTACLLVRKASPLYLFGRSGGQSKPGRLAY